VAVDPSIIRLDSARLEAATAHPPSLRDSGIRLAWSAQQIGCLQAWELDFINEGRLTSLAVEVDAAASAYVIREKALPNPPVAMTLLAADAVHSMRASLDYLAQHLVRANGKEPKEGLGGTAFPIEHEREAKLWGISDEAREILRDLQPAAAGDEYAKHPLYLLHWLSILDKHRFLNMLRVEGGYDMTTLLVGEKVLEIPRLHRGWGIIDDGKEVARIPVERVDPFAAVKLSGHSFGITAFERFAPGSPQLPASETLHTIHDHLVNVVFPAFFKVLPGLADDTRSPDRRDDPPGGT
jgi:hypothetical protein